MNVSPITERRSAIGLAAWMASASETPRHPMLKISQSRYEGKSSNMVGLSEAEKKNVRLRLVRALQFDRPLPPLM